MRTRFERVFFYFSTRGYTLGLSHPQTRYQPRYFWFSHSPKMHLLEKIYGCLSPSRWVPCSNLTWPKVTILFDLNIPWKWKCLRNIDKKQIMWGKHFIHHSFNNSLMLISKFLADLGAIPIRKKRHKTNIDYYESWYIFV